jgi:hypothetical protein
MGIAGKPRALRIISGNAAYIEGELNRLADEYSGTQWNYAVVKDELLITVVLIHHSELRKMQLMQAGQVVRRGN